MARTSDRGYGTAHQQLRKKWAIRIQRGDIECARCGRLIDPDTPWDLGHDDEDRSVYVGPEHQKCNRQTKTHQAIRRHRRSRAW